ncbi:hypothetical protein CEUSTIGMA_g1878.t1 [Chlamydomonas eustigma]|uniref:Uncharacterized protein n=1 Tax=Chlamydomonas eustigma TaxID=1157962 RepID=A0A250WUN6_9CHLO|nr:hypothetical protein CEUSTIGMA_g1878.t1 [Chlamydomonas eustigma]|eukprot:GAX74429.1 hypothetical protein CEUSTIGMA_g1878.t1 [Chlamydomonas eustigma]
MTLSSVKQNILGELEGPLGPGGTMLMDLEAEDDLELIPAALSDRTSRRHPSTTTTSFLSPHHNPNSSTQPQQQASRPLQLLPDISADQASCTISQYFCRSGAAAESGPVSSSSYRDNHDDVTPQHNHQQSLHFNKPVVRVAGSASSVMGSLGTSSRIKQDSAGRRAAASATSKITASSSSRYAARPVPGSAPPPTTPSASTPSVLLASVQTTSSRDEAQHIRAKLANGLAGSRGGATTVISASSESPAAVQGKVPAAVSRIKQGQLLVTSTASSAAASTAAASASVTSTASSAAASATAKYDSYYEASSYKTPPPNRQPRPYIPAAQSQGSSRASINPTSTASSTSRVSSRLKIHTGADTSTAAHLPSPPITTPTTKTRAQQKMSSILTPPAASAAVATAASSMVTAAATASYKQPSSSTVKHPLRRTVVLPSPSPASGGTLLPQQYSNTSSSIIKQQNTTRNSAATRAAASSTGCSSSTAASTRRALTTTAVRPSSSTNKVSQHAAAAAAAATLQAGQAGSQRTSSSVNASASRGDEQSAAATTAFSDVMSVMSVRPSLHAELLDLDEEGSCYQFEGDYDAEDVQSILMEQELVDDDDIMIMEVVSNDDAFHRRLLPVGAAAADSLLDPALVHADLLDLEADPFVEGGEPQYDMQMSYQTVGARFSLAKIDDDDQQQQHYGQLVIKQLQDNACDQQQRQQSSSSGALKGGEMLVISKQQQILAADEAIKVANISEAASASAADYVDSDLPLQAEAADDDRQQVHCTAPVAATVAASTTAAAAAGGQLVARLSVRSNLLSSKFPSVLGVQNDEEANQHSPSVLGVQNDEEATQHSSSVLGVQNAEEATQHSSSVDPAADTANKSVMAEAAVPAAEVTDSPAADYTSMLTACSEGEASSDRGRSDLPHPSSATSITLPSASLSSARPAELLTLMYSHDEDDDEGIPRVRAGSRSCSSSSHLPSATPLKDPALRLQEQQQQLVPAASYYQHSALSGTSSMMVAADADMTTKSCGVMMRTASSLATSDVSGRIAQEAAKIAEAMMIVADTQTSSTAMIVADTQTSSTAMVVAELGGGDPLHNLIVAKSASSLARSDFSGFSTLTLRGSSFLMSEASRVAEAFASAESPGPTVNMETEVMGTLNADYEHHAPRYSPHMKAKGHHPTSHPDHGGSVFCLGAQTSSTTDVAEEQGVYQLPILNSYDICPDESYRLDESTATTSCTAVACLLVDAVPTEAATSEGCMIQPVLASHEPQVLLDDLYTRRNGDELRGLKAQLQEKAVPAALGAGQQQGAVVRPAVEAALQQENHLHPINIVIPSAALSEGHAEPTAAAYHQDPRDPATAALNEDPEPAAAAQYHHQYPEPAAAAQYHHQYPEPAAAHHHHEDPIDPVTALNEDYELAAANAQNEDSGPYRCIHYDGCGDPNPISSSRADAEAPPLHLEVDSSNRIVTVGNEWLVVEEQEQQHSGEQLELHKEEEQQHSGGDQLELHKEEEQEQQHSGEELEQHKEEEEEQQHRKEEEEHCKEEVEGHECGSYGADSDWSDVADADADVVADMTSSSARAVVSDMASSLSSSSSRIMMMAGMGDDIIRLSNTPNGHDGGDGNRSGRGSASVDLPEAPAAGNVADYADVAEDNIAAATADDCVNSRDIGSDATGGAIKADVEENPAGHPHLPPAAHYTVTALDLDLEEMEAAGPAVILRSPQRDMTSSVGEAVEVVEEEIGLLGCLQQQPEGEAAEVVEEEIGLLGCLQQQEGEAVEVVEEAEIGLLRCLQQQEEGVMSSFIWADRRRHYNSMSTGGAAAVAVTPPGDGTKGTAIMATMQGVHYAFSDYVAEGVADVDQDNGQLQCQIRESSSCADRVASTLMTCCDDVSDEPSAARGPGFIPPDHKSADSPQESWASSLDEERYRALGREPDLKVLGYDDIGVVSPSRSKTVYTVAELRTVVAELQEVGTTTAAELSHQGSNSVITTSGKTVVAELMTVVAELHTEITADESQSTSVILVAVDTAGLHDTAAAGLHDTAAAGLHDTAAAGLHDTAAAGLHDTAATRSVERRDLQSSLEVPPNRIDQAAGQGQQQQQQQQLLSDAAVPAAVGMEDLLLLPQSPAYLLSSHANPPSGGEGRINEEKSNVIAVTAVKADHIEHHHEEQQPPLPPYDNVATMMDLLGQLPDLTDDEEVVLEVAAGEEAGERNQEEEVDKELQNITSFQVVILHGNASSRGIPHMADGESKEDYEAGGSCKEQGSTAAMSGGSCKELDSTAAMSGGSCKELGSTVAMSGGSCKELGSTVAMSGGSCKELGSTATMSGGSCKELGSTVAMSGGSCKELGSTVAMSGGSCKELGSTAAMSADSNTEVKDEASHHGFHHDHLRITDIHDDTKTATAVAADPPVAGYAVVVVPADPSSSAAGGTGRCIASPAVVATPLLPPTSEAKADEDNEIIPSVAESPVAASDQHIHCHAGSQSCVIIPIDQTREQHNAGQEAGSLVHPQKSRGWILQSSPSASLPQNVDIKGGTTSVNDNNPASSTGSSCSSWLFTCIPSCFSLSSAN